MLHVAFAVLHPRHKLQYFRDVGWEDDWIATAERIARDRFESGYCEVTDEPQVDVEDSEVRRRVAHFSLLLHLEIMAIFL